MNSISIMNAPFDPRGPDEETITRGYILFQNTHMAKSMYQILQQWLKRCEGLKYLPKPDYK